jgi:peptide-methionine (S)-S-oxide reductase
MGKALIGAGCFWGIEEYFRKLEGIKKTSVGYSGGKLANPTYKDVCTGSTEHAEVVLIEYNEVQLSYSELLDYFWRCHDPTQINGQGLDRGTQYRSVIFYYSNEQKEIAENSKKEFQKNISKAIVTNIDKANEFFLAEDYHQRYIQKKNLL